MAGERYAKLTIRAAWSWVANTRGRQTEEVRFKLAGLWETYRRGATSSSNEFVVPDPSSVTPARDFVKQGVQNLLDRLHTTLFLRGLSYSISALRDAGDDGSHVGQGGGFNQEYVAWPIIEFDILANVYDASYDLDFADYSQAAQQSLGGWQVVSNVTTIRPVLVQANVLNATIYNSATGQIELVASNGTTGSYSYQWDDQIGLGAALRPNLVGPRTYGCLVTDQSGASTYVSVPVGADPRLEVLATTTATSITLLITGGLPPYTVLWDDGATTTVRTGLAPAVYRVVVTDSRGAVQDLVIDLNRQAFHWSRNPILLPLDAGTAYRLDPTTKPNLSFLCEVWLEPDYLSGTFIQVGTTLEQPADRQGRTTFDVQALLEAYLAPHVPAVGSTVPERADSLFKRFYLVHREQFGTPPVPAAATSQDYRYVVQGGLSFYEASARTWFKSYQRQHLPFLTWEPATKPVLDDQPEYLYFMVPPTATDWRAFLRVSFGASPAQVIPLWQAVTGAAGAEVYCLPVGYQALGLAGFAGLNLTIAWWEVWVASPDGLTVLSETRRFVRQRRRYPHRRFFLFQTSLGGMATYAALGEAQGELEVSGAETQLTLAPDYDPQLGDVLVQQRQVKPVLKVAAGVRTQAQLTASQDLLLSRRVLLLSGSRWVPGFLKAKTVPLFDEGKLVQVQEFEFVQPTEQLFTPDL